MLEITIPPSELFDESKNEFYYTSGQTIRLEHSLFSMSKWESRWHVPFLSKNQKTAEQTIDYIRCMTINEGVDPMVYNAIPNTELERINAYIDDPMTATTFSNSKMVKSSSETITSELVYYWMTALNIPMECQYWHLNRLLTLVRICSIKNAPNKKMSKRDLMSKNKKLNQARRKKLNSRG